MFSTVDFLRFQIQSIRYSSVCGYLKKVRSKAEWESAYSLNTPCKHSPVVEQNKTVKWSYSPWYSWGKGLCWKEFVKEPSFKPKMKDRRSEWKTEWYFDMYIRSIATVSISTLRWGPNTSYFAVPYFSWIFAPRGTTLDEVSEGTHLSLILQRSILIMH